jgi:hypothetical protein
MKVPAAFSVRRSGFNHMSKDGSLLCVLSMSHMLTHLALSLLAVSIVETHSDGQIEWG